MIKPLIAAEDQGSNFLDSIQEIENAFDSRLSKVILNKNFSTKKIEFSFDLEIKMDIIFFFEPIVEKNIKNLKLKFNRSTDYLYSMKELVDLVIKNYSENGWDGRLNVIYEDFKVFSNNKFYEMIVSSFHSTHSREIKRSVTIGKIEILEVFGVI